MKILQILPELNVGGVERGTVDFAKYLVEHGHKSIVVSNGGRMVEQLVAQGSIHYVLPVHKKNIFLMFALVKRLRRIILEEEVDIVHARSRVPAWIAFFACRKTKAQFVTTCHGYYKSPWFSQVMGWGKKVIVPSEVIGMHMVEDFRVERDNIRLIPRSVDLDKFNIQRQNKPGQSEFVVTILGRITPLKGHNYFIEAMAKVVRTMPYVKIWIIGDAPANKLDYKESLVTLVQRLGLKDHVHFLGNRSDVNELLAKSDVVVLSTVTQEAFGRVILEAQAAGVPVVATKVGGVVDIIDDGETGLLVMPKDVDGMAREVMRLIKDRDLAQRLVINARQKLENNFTLEHMASRTVAVYEEVLHSTNILVIKISSIGDVVLVTASLKALREKFPKAKIYCLVGKESRKVLNNCPYVTGLIVYDLQSKDKGWAKFWKFTQKLRKYKFDMIVDFQNNRKSHLLCFLTFPRESFGYDNKKWGFLLSHAIKDVDKFVQPVEHQFRLLKPLGIEFNETRRLELWPSVQDEEYVQELFDSEWLGNARKIVGINISASAKWPTKNWPLEHIAALCDMLSAKGVRVILTGSEVDKWKSRRVLTLSQTKPADFVGKTTLLQMAAVARRCHVFITPDSAPLHIAAAMGTAVVAIFGPTDSRRHMPPIETSSVFYRSLPCVPCYSRECKIKTHACLREITPEEIARQVFTFLGKKREHSFSHNTH